MNGQTADPHGNEVSAPGSPSKSVPRSLVRTLLLLSLVMAVPIVPFLLWNDQLSNWISQLREAGPSREKLAWLTVALLASDMLLPIPSSFMCTWAGAEFGLLRGTLLTWLGLTIGTTLGFGIARAAGPRVVHWLTRSADMADVETFVARYGAVLLALLRGVPVVAEASVLWMGLHRLSWRAFVIAVWPANLVIALAYALLGEVAARAEWLPMALAASTALPLGLLELIRRYLRRSSAHRE